jgi:Flp pilus assembly protein TadG
VKRLRTTRNERAQNLIEFAMLLPIVLVFIFALVMFGIALNTRSNLQQAVREGARQAAVGSTFAQVQAQAAGNASESIVANEVRWCLPAGSTGKVGDTVRVYIDEGNNGSEGFNFTFVPADGLFSMFSVGSFGVNMKPRGTARLEKNRTADSIPACA